MQNRPFKTSAKAATNKNQSQTQVESSMHRPQLRVQPANSSSTVSNAKKQPKNSLRLSESITPYGIQPGIQNLDNDAEKNQ